MELFNPKKLNFQFTKTFKAVGIVSVLLVIASVVLSLVAPKLNYGIDFRGGVEAQVAFKDASITSEGLRSVLNEKLKDFSLVEVDAAEGREFFITAQSSDTENISLTLSELLNKNFGAENKGWEITKMDSVGPKIGSELRTAALLSLFYTCILITLFIYWRFDLRYSPGALLSIFHDLIVTFGFLALTGIEFSTSVVAALLTLAGYSINDTVVLYDRIRELEARLLGKSKKAIVDAAINSTLPRTIMTSLTTLLAVGVLWWVGGPALKAFSMTLFFGICLGTYSSIFVASPLYLLGDKFFAEKVKAAQNKKPLRA